MGRWANGPFCKAEENFAPIPQKNACVRFSIQFQGTHRSPGVPSLQIKSLCMSLPLYIYVSEDKVSSAVC